MRKLVEFIGVYAIGIAVCLLMAVAVNCKPDRTIQIGEKRDCPVCETCQPCPSCPETASGTQTASGGEATETKAEAEEEPVDPNFKEGAEGYFADLAAYRVANTEPIKVDEEFSLDFDDWCYVNRTQARLVARLGETEVIVEVDGSSSQIPDEWAKLANRQTAFVICPPGARFAVSAKKWPQFVAEQKKILEEKAKIRKATGSPDE